MDEKVKSLIGQLKKYADEEGCSVSELVEKYEGAEDDAEEMDGEDDGKGGKLALIVARMKAKNKPEEEYEG